jgi:hypothetical protein
MTTPAYSSTRIWTRTIKKLRLIAALTGERIVQVLDRLADHELARLRTDEQHEQHEPHEQQATRDE